MLVNYWDPETKAFNLDGKPLRIEVDDIYFITGLPCRGDVVNIKAQGVGGGMNIEDYIATHCVAGTDKVESQLPIKAIKNPSLKIGVLVLTWISRLALLHKALRLLMFYAVECLRITFYEWCTLLLTNMKSQLMDCKQGIKRNFKFASILCSFFFEWVPCLSPSVEIIPHRPCDPAMSRWTDAMRRLEGGRVPTPFNNEFFFWWHQQVIAIDHYPYVGIDYRGDPYMPLPPGSAYGDIGMKRFCVFYFFVFFQKE